MTSSKGEFFVSTYKLIYTVTDPARRSLLNREKGTQSRKRKAGIILQ